MTLAFAKGGDTVPIHTLCNKRVNRVVLSFDRGEYATTHAKDITRFQLNRDTALLRCTCDSLTGRRALQASFARTRLLTAACGCKAGLTTETWLILPVVIRLSQRLSHACLSISTYTVKLRMAHYISYSLFDSPYYLDNRSNSRANTCANS